MMNKPCVRCLLEETGQEELLEGIRELISLIPPEKRTESELYQRRLALCRNCQSLKDGVCGRCGCYVELRAAKREMGCPSEKKIW